MSRLLLFLSLPLYLLDQATKLWVIGHFAPPTEEAYDEIEVVRGFFWLHRLHNTGVAFGRFNGGKYSNYIFGGISVVALMAILTMWKRGAFPTWTGRTAAALLVTGIIGNLTDRLWHGYVVDFLRFDLKFMVWPSFNVADSCICIAAGLLIISTFQQSAAGAVGDAAK